jgi:hypothetical protein
MGANNIQERKRSMKSVGICNRVKSGTTTLYEENIRITAQYHVDMHTALNPDLFWHEVLPSRASDRNGPY